jgi:hypothetical protein
MKKAAYVFGMLSGVVLANYWKLLVKEGVKAGVRAGQAVRRVSEEALEDIQDASAEALEELAQHDRKEGR